VTRRLLVLCGATLALWVLISLPARALMDDPEGKDRFIGYSGTALLLCLIPTAITLAWSSAALRRAPETQLAAVMGGTGVRLLTVLVAAWALNANVAFFQHASFWNWLLGAYLVTLALEMTLLLTGRTVSAPRP
jgi:hypothetical protein